MRIPGKNKPVKNWFKSEQGAAAVEMAFVMPFMLLMYFGTMDLTGLITFNRKITAAVSTVGDLVAAQRTTVLKSQITDFYNGAYMIMQPSPAASTRVEVYDFYVDNTKNVVQRWATNNNSGPTDCGVAVDTSGFKKLMEVGLDASNNMTYADLVVTRGCINYTPYIATFMGQNLLGSTTFNVTQTIMTRPRSSQTLAYDATK